MGRKAKVTLGFVSILRQAQDTAGSTNLGTGRSMKCKARKILGPFYFIVPKLNTRCSRIRFDPSQAQGPERIQGSGKGIRKYGLAARGLTICKGAGM